jgi:hypothetical protein
VLIPNASCNLLNRDGAHMLTMTATARRSQAERQLLLLSAGTAARRRAAGAHAGRLAKTIDWSQLTETLCSRRLLTVLGPRILDLADGRASEGFADELNAAIQAGRRQGALLQLISIRIMAALAAAGIRSSPLKGPLLGEIIYGDPGRRPSGDIDLLVDPEQLHAAVEVARGLGYAAPTDYVEHRGMPLLHFALVHERGELPRLELHWRIHWYERGFARERLLPHIADPTSSWRPAPADELASLLLFYARDGFVDLRLAADVGAWWDVFGPALQPDGFAELLADYPALGHVLLVAVKVAERVVGTSTTHMLSDMPRLGVRDRVAMRLANPNPRSSQPQLYADTAVVDALLTPRGHFASFVRRQVLPPGEVLHDRARRTPDQRGITPLGHGVRVLGRYVLTITRLVRAPETLRLP